MTEKEKQIEEMAYSICPMPQACEYITDCTKCGGNGDCIRQKFAEMFLKKGYRKQSEVAENIIAMIRAAKPIIKTYFEAYDELIENIAAEYDVEAEK